MALFLYSISVAAESLSWRCTGGTKHLRAARHDGRALRQRGAPRGLVGDVRRRQRARLAIDKRDRFPRVLAVSELFSTSMCMFFEPCARE